MNFVNIRQNIKELKDYWETINSSNKIELYNYIMNPSSSSNGVVDGDAVHSDICQFYMIHQPVKELERDNQYAYAIVVMENNHEEFFPIVCPDFDNKKHSEEILIEKIEAYLHHAKKGKINSPKYVSIFTNNSPCLKRKANIDPCMFKLLDRACEWYLNYGLLTRVFYKKFWGFTGPKYFNSLTFHSVSSPSSGFYPYFEECMKIPFKLDGTKLKDIFKKSTVFHTLRDMSESSKQNKQELHENITTARRNLVSLAESSDGLYEEHLDLAKQIIATFNFFPEVHDKICRILQKEWIEMLKNSLMIPIREKITSEFNRKSVIHFENSYMSFLGNSSPLSLYYIPHA